MNSKHKKPSIACDWLLSKILSKTEYSEKSGDFEEVYRHLSDEEGAFKAGCWYWSQVVRALPTFISITFHSYMAMLSNYMKVALRNIRKYKIYSFINIFGLAVGIAGFLLIMLHVRYQLSYDTYHENADRIYRIRGSVPGPLAPALKEEFPEVIETARLNNSGGLISHADVRYYERRVFLTDPALFDILTVRFIHGSPETALSDRNGMVITRSMAQKYFGEAMPLGKTISLENRFDFRITGVVEDPPQNSAFQFDFLGSFLRVEEIGEWNYLTNWACWNFNTILLLAEGARIKNIEERSPEFFKRYAGESYANVRLLFQNITDVHRQSSFIQLYSAIAFIILIVACINFMNLASARSIKRMKEVGLRKVVGANRAKIIQQFIGESVVHSCLALGTALILLQLSLPFFTTHFDLETGHGFFKDFRVWIGFLLVAIIVGVFSGSYPAFFASSFQPIKALAGMKTIRRSKNLLRNSLVVIQYTVSIILILCTLILSKQMNFMRNRQLGYNQDYLMNIPIHKDIRPQVKTLKTELLRHPGIINVTASDFTPGNRPYWQGVWWEGQNDNDENGMHWIAAGFDFVKTMELELIAGRDFSDDFPADENSNYILNESAVKRLGWNDPVGRRFRVIGGNNTTGVVVGVVKDFHFKSMRHDLEPLIIYLHSKYFRHLTVRIGSENLDNTLHSMQKTWNTVIPDRPFEFYFLDERFDTMYRVEKKWKRIFECFALLSIGIVCMGLFGLISFMAEQRTKEVGIRKVLGASVPGIVALLSREFLFLIVVSNVIAWPMGFFLMRKLLSFYAYRVSLEIDIFLLSAVIVFIVSLITVSFQAIKTALNNPVDSLRYE